MARTIPTLTRRAPRLKAVAGALAAAGALLASSAWADIKIGVLVPLSGKGASYGDASAYLLALASNARVQRARLDKTIPATR